jgi:hypothetical protein
VNQACIWITKNVTTLEGRSFTAATWVNPDDVSLYPHGDFWEDQCSPGIIATSLYFVIFIIFCGTILLNLVRTPPSSVHDLTTQPGQDTSLFCIICIMTSLLNLVRTPHSAS